MVALTSEFGVHADTTTIDTTQQLPTGTRAKDKDGNEYVYLKGVASTTANSVVTFDEAHTTALITANAVGRVAVAMAATVASNWGWYCIHGTTTAKCDTIADNKACYIDGTDGRVDDAVVAGDLVVGMISRSTDSSNLCTVELNYPCVNDVLG